MSNVQALRQEAAEMDEELLHRIIFETVQAGILVIDADSHRILAANPKAADMIGLPPEQLVGALCHRFICPAEEGGCPITDLGLRIDNSERVLVTATGRTLPILKTVSEVKVGGKTRLVETFLDISSQKQAEATLTESEERFRDLFENVSDLIHKVDSAGSFLYVNPSWISTLGYQVEEVLLLSFADIVAPESLEAFEAVFRQIVAGEPVRRVETQFITRDGRCISVEGRLTCSYGNGRVSGIRFIWRDVTEQKKAQRLLEEWNRSLEARIEEKARELKAAEMKLIRQEKMAVIGELVGGAAHELQNPLAGIRGAVEMCMKKRLAMPPMPETEEELQVLEEVEKAVRRCQQVVHDLSIVSAGSVCSFGTVDVDEVLSIAVRFLEIAPERGVSVAHHRNSGLPGIEGDRVQLVDAFLHVLENARDAMAEQGEIAVFAKLAQTAEGERVMVTVRDGGCGIPRENLPRVFDPFFTTKPAGKGQGLGLTAAYGVVKKHHGDIDIVSIEGEGTEVTITLPLRQPA